MNRSDKGAAHDRATVDDSPTTRTTSPSKAGVDQRGTSPRQGVGRARRRVDHLGVVMGPPRLEFERPTVVVHTEQHRPALPGRCSQVNGRFPAVCADLEKWPKATTPGLEALPGKGPGPRHSGMKPLAARARDEPRGRLGGGCFLKGASLERPSARPALRARSFSDEAPGRALLPPSSRSGRSVPGRSVPGRSGPRRHCPRCRLQCPVRHLQRCWLRYRRADQAVGASNAFGLVGLGSENDPRLNTRNLTIQTRP